MVLVIDGRDVMKRFETKDSFHSKDQDKARIKLSVDGQKHEKLQCCTKMIVTGIYLVSVTDPTLA